MLLIDDEPQICGSRPIAIVFSARWLVAKCDALLHTPWPNAGPPPTTSVRVHLVVGGGQEIFIVALIFAKAIVQRDWEDDIAGRGPLE